MYQILSSGVRETGPREKGKFLLGEEAWKTLGRLRWVVWPAGMLLPRFGDAQTRCQGSEQRRRDVE